MAHFHFYFGTLRIGQTSLFLANGPWAKWLNNGMHITCLCDSRACLWCACARGCQCCCIIMFLNSLLDVEYKWQVHHYPIHQQKSSVACTCAQLLNRHSLLLMLGMYTMHEARLHGPEEASREPTNVNCSAGFRQPSHNGNVHGSHNRIWFSRRMEYNATRRKLGNMLIYANMTWRLCICM